MAITEYMLTTVDNPYNPFNDFDAWYAYDSNAGYYSCAYLARIAMDSPELTDAERTIEINRAIQEIIDYDPTGLYIKINEKDADAIIAKNMNANESKSNDNDETNASASNS